MRMRDLRALVAKLEEANAGPDDLVLFDSANASVMIVRVRAGMHQACDSTELRLTEEDKQFLRALRIPH